MTNCPCSLSRSNGATAPPPLGSVLNFVYSIPVLLNGHGRRTLPSCAFLLDPPVRPHPVAKGVHGQRLFLQDRAVERICLRIFSDLPRALQPAPEATLCSVVNVGPWLRLLVLFGWVLKAELAALAL